MNCSELLDLFEKYGGILTCDYNKNTVTMKNTNLKCNISGQDYTRLELMTFEWSCGGGVAITHLEKKPITYDELIHSDIKLYNRFLNNNEYGFTIDFSNK